MNKPASALIVMVSLIAFSCSEKSPSEPEAKIFDVQGENGFVGTVEESDAFICIVAGENKVVAYVCNGDEHISEWFNGAVNDPTAINLNNDKNARLSARFENESFEGEVTLSSGVTHTFRATPATTPEAGIYRVMDDAAAAEHIEAGWIVASNGEERGALLVRSAFLTTPALPKTDVSSGKSFAVFHFRIQPPGPAPPIPIPYPHFPFPTPTKPGG